jgi:uncharacterized membrane protein YtjA (UPF0391 family)
MYSPTKTRTRWVWHSDCICFLTRDERTLERLNTVSFKAVITNFNQRKLRCEMLSWALTFLIVALIAAALGFGGIAGAATGIAKVLFFVFLVLFLISLVIPRMRGSV